jgi:CRISPR-associated protein Cas4
MIAVSLLSSYLYCPRRIFLEKVLGIRPPPAPPTFKGTVKHKVFDLINKYEEDLVTSIKSFQPFDDVFALYRRKYYKILSNTIIEFKPKLKELNIDPMQLFHKSWETFLKEARVRASNVFQFIKENKIYGTKLWENLTPKYLTELFLESKNLQLRGIIDKVEVNKGNYMPIELKSGNPPKTGVWPGNKIQLLAYILLLKEKYNATEGYIHYIDHDDKRTITFNPFSEQEVIKIRDNITNLLESKTPPKIQENKNKCTNCQLKEQCFKISS